jgi:hypothetical protein
MKKLIVFALLLMLGGMAFAQCGQVFNKNTNSMMTPGPGDTPDYFACANYANSPLPRRSCSLPDATGAQVPVIDSATSLPVSCYGNVECLAYADAAGNVATCNGPIEVNTGIQKFIETLPVDGGIPAAVPEAVALLRTGRRIKVDLGQVTCGGRTWHFLEACAVGLVSALFPAADDIQHGNLARIGDFLATLVTSPAAEMRLVFDARVETAALSHAVLIANMPYVGPRYRVSPAAAPDDGLLDVLIFADLSKLDLLGYVVQEVVGGGASDHRIQYRRVRKLAIATEPAMPILADGVPLGSGPLRIEVRPRALAVMAGPEPAAALAGAAESLGETIPAQGEAAGAGAAVAPAAWVVSSDKAAHGAA